MTDAEQREAARQFANKWMRRGNEEIVSIIFRKIISLVIKQSIERFFDTVTDQIFEIILYEILVKLYNVVRHRYCLLGRFGVVT
jgi:hypothetical protein